MSRYAKIETFIWHDEKFQGLTDDARMLFLYLLTSPHGNMCGIFYLPELYAASDLQWAPERYRRGIEALSKASRIATDGNVIWLKNHVKHNTPRGKNQIIGFVNALEKIPSNNLIKEYIDDLRKHLLDEDFALFEELYKIPYDIPLRRGSEAPTHTPSITESDTDTESDTVSGSGSGAQAPTEKEQDDDADKKLLGELTKEFAIAFGYPPNQTQVEMLLSFSGDGMADELILEALKRSAQNGAKGPTYTKAILQSWLNKGALTMVDVERLDGVLSRQTPSNRTGETAAERLLREEIEREQAEANIIDVIDVAWSEGG